MRWVAVLVMAGCAEEAAPEARREVPAAAPVLPVQVRPAPLRPPPTLLPPAAEPLPSPSEPAATGGMAEAQQALGRGDTDGVIRALEGRTESARELSLLIETYRQVGNSAAACRNIELYLRQYPTGVAAAQYGQLHARTCSP